MRRGGLVRNIWFNSILIFVGFCSAIVLIPATSIGAPLQNHLEQAPAADPETWNPPFQDRVEPFFTTKLSQPFPSHGKMVTDETPHFFLGDGDIISPDSDNEPDILPSRHLNPKYTFTTPSGVLRGIPNCFYEIDQDCFRQPVNH